MVGKRKVGSTTTEHVWTGSQSNSVVNLVYRLGSLFLFTFTGREKVSLSVENEGPVLSRRLTFILVKEKKGVLYFWNF